jgi:hypothetical protein
MRSPPALTGQDLFEIIRRYFNVSKLPFKTVGMPATINKTVSESFARS